ncbi:hypothetical protein HED60_05795 [Planctomycetales bacterium ZRK34]|nr:hypothetical protein HED60_05795 [Planctomycetales bacterium ZRK34]
MADAPDTPDISKWPLLVFMERLGAWAGAARREDFWRDMVEHQMWADQLRDEAKGIIVWLELRGQDDAASRLDDAMSNVRQAIWNLREACEGVYPPEEPRCDDAREAMIEAASRAAGVAEDLHDEVPEEVWEGFFDG